MALAAVVATVDILVEEALAEVVLPAVLAGLDQLAELAELVELVELVLLVLLQY